MKQPSFQFYPGDWLRESGLRSCTVGARGLWIDMLCHMHQATPYGHLITGEKVILPPTLARMVGATLDEVEGWLQELESAGVFSRDGEGRIFSRRMIRDEEIRQSRAAGGFKGGNPVLRTKGRITSKDNLSPTLPPTTDPTIGITPSSSSSSSSLSSSSSSSSDPNAMSTDSAVSDETANNKSEPKPEPEQKSEKKERKKSVPKEPDPFAIAAQPLVQKFDTWRKEQTASGVTNWGAQVSMAANCLKGAKSGAPVPPEEADAALQWAFTIPKWQRQLLTSGLTNLLAIWADWKQGGDYQTWTGQRDPNRQSRAMASLQGAMLRAQAEEEGQ